MQLLRDLLVDQLNRAPPLDPPHSSRSSLPNSLPMIPSLPRPLPPLFPPSDSFKELLPWPPRLNAPPARIKHSRIDTTQFNAIDVSPSGRTGDQVRALLKAWMPANHCLSLPPPLSLLPSCPPALLTS